MKQVMTCLLAASVSFLPCGPGPVGALARVLVRTNAGSVMTTAGIAGAAGIGQGVSQGSGAMLPVVGLDVTLKPVSSMSPQVFQAQVASVQALPIVYLRSQVPTDKTPGASVESGDIFSAQRWKTDQKDDEKKGSEIGAAFARWRDRFDGSRSAGDIAPPFGVEDRAHFRRRVSGLSPPSLTGKRPLADYRPAKSISMRRTLGLTVHFGLLAAGVAAVMAGFGVVPILAGAALLAADLYWQEKVFGSLSDEGAYAFDTELMGEDAKTYKRYIEETLRLAVARLGLDSSLAPRVRVMNKRGKIGAAIEGRSISSDSLLTIGEGYADLPAEDTMSVLSHELGHLVGRDFGRFRLLRNRIGFSFGIEVVRKLAVYGFLLHFAAVWFAPAALTVAAGSALFAGLVRLSPRFARVMMSAREWFTNFKGRQVWSMATIGAMAAALYSALEPFSLVSEALWALAGISLAAAGLLSGIAVTRQEELRADHFAGWLTRPDWLADHFRRRVQREQEVGFFAGLRRRLLSSHPSYDRRIAELEKEL